MPKDLPHNGTAATEDSEARIRKLNQELQERLALFTQPLDDPAAVRFEDLVDLQTLQAMQDAFAKATGVASIITDPAGNPITKPSNFCRLCEFIIRKTPLGLSNCLHSDAVLGRRSTEDYVMQPCLSGGLWDGGTSIMVGEHHIANWLIGQVLEEEADLGKMMDYARLIGAEPEAYREALRQVKRMPRAQFEEVCKALRLLANQISNMGYQNLQQARFIAERRKAEQALKESEEKFAMIFRMLPVLASLTELDGTLLDVNETWQQTLGHSRDQAIGRTAQALGIWAVPEQREGMMALLKADGSFHGFRMDARTAQGEVLQMTVNGGFVTLKGRSVLLVTFSDITQQMRAEEEQRQLDAKLQHAQKLESLGVLAGGIAHDFNNLLTSVLGNADLALAELPPLAPARENLQGIETAAHRAAELCRQLLAYSGKGRFQVQPLDLRQLVEEMGHLLSVSISKHAALKYDFAPDLPTIEADASQMRQVVMNLITNASEAIGQRNGIIYIRTGVLDFDPERPGDAHLGFELKRGAYVFLEVSDSGAGMSAETCRRIFDPFFTTKFTGRGLGLAAVLGIVHGHKGAIKVYSEEGRGTTFKMLFPASQAPAQPVPGSAGDAAWKGKGKVLLVDDEETVRSVGRAMLERAGLTVVTAMDGLDALEVFGRERGIDCVVLDLTMPRMDGEECFRELRRIKPSVNVILSSGYNEQDAISRFIGKGLAGFVQKPYRTAELLARVRAALETGV